MGTSSQDYLQNANFTYAAKRLNPLCSLTPLPGHSGPTSQGLVTGKEQRKALPNSE